MYRGLTVEDLFDIVLRHPVHFEQTHQTGVVFHMMGALSEFGRTGLTAIGDSPQEADAIFSQTVDALTQEAEGAFQDVVLP